MGSVHELCHLCQELNQNDGTQLCQLISADWQSFRTPNRAEIKHTLIDNEGFKQNCPYYPELFPPKAKQTKRQSRKKS